MVLAVKYRPALLDRSHTPHLDLCMFAVLGAALLQVIPLPRGVLSTITPSALTVARSLVLVDPGGPLPITIDLPRSASAILLIAGVLLLFFTARQIFDTGGVRTTTRLIVLTGLVLSAIALAQDATAHGLMYWRWRPVDQGPNPFGPFVNRNHFATWAMMAVPLGVGYLTAHASAHHGAGPTATWQRKVVAAIDARAWMLLASATLLIVAIAASLSRSGLLGLAAALACGGALARWRHRSDAASLQSRGATANVFRARTLVWVLGVIAALAVLTQVGPGAIAGRFGASRVAVADRLAIWHDTLPVLRDFWLTGTGVGTFLTSMGVYQRSSPGVIFNQAHNHYLQVAAEGGLLVGLPVAIALVAFVRVAWRSLETDRSGMFWIRAGGASGLCGVAIQSVWETGLTAPANAAMAAVLAAIVIHVPMRFESRSR
jgi:O-antigen ligase/polysaccharide polymerase Wzy-like membrane protein